MNTQTPSSLTYVDCNHWVCSVGSSFFCAVYRLMLRIGHSARSHRLKLDEVLRENKIQGPGECDANLFFQARKFAQIDRSPEPPGKKSRERDAEDFGDTGTMADGSEKANGFEAEWPFCCAADCRNKIGGGSLGLADRVLCCWRVKPTG